MTTNGIVAAGVTCDRCDANGFQTTTALADHLRDSRNGHAMPPDRAQRVAAQAFNGHAAAPVVVLPPTLSDVPHHICPKCATQIPCMWETIAQIEAQATRLKMLAAQLTRKQMGQGWGAPRKDATWTDEDVLAAYKSGLSILAIAKMYSAGKTTIQKALKRVGAK